MNIVVSSAALGTAVAMLQRVINTKNALPILGDIKCEVSNDQMKLTASDSEVFMHTTLPIATDCDGNFCVPASKLNSALAQLPEQPITMQVDIENTQLTIEHQSGKVYFPIDNADEYPAPIDAEFGEAVKIDGTLLADAIKRGSFAIDNNELRPVMNCMYYGLQDGFLDIVASDGTKLAKSHICVKDADVRTEQNMKIPRKVANLLGKLLTADQIEVRTCDLFGEIKADPYTITFRQVEGKYPNYNSVIPEAQPHSAVVHRLTLMNSIAKVAPFANDSSNLLVLTFEAGKLTLTADDYDFSQGATDTLTIVYTGEPLTIGVKASALHTLLGKMPGQEVEIMMSDPSRAITFEPSEELDDVDITMLTMPMLIND